MKRLLEWCLRKRKSGNLFEKKAATIIIQIPYVYSLYLEWKALRVLKAREKKKLSGL